MSTPVAVIPENTTAQFKRQLPRNLCFQSLSFISHVAIGIWLVPYLVQHLGRAAYGLIPLAGMMTQYVNLISYSISSAVTRFLTIALQRNDVAEANRIFNTAFFSYLGIGLIQVPVFGLLICHANTIFSIPEKLYRDAILLLVCSAVSFLINLMCSVFQVPIYANNRLDISRGIDMARQIVRLTGIVVLFGLYGPTLRCVGYVDLSITVIQAALYVLAAKRLAPFLRLAARDYNWSKVRQLAGMGGWLLVNQMGALLFLRIDVWVCNRFISAESAGDYAAVLQWSNLLRQAGTVLAGVTAPMVVIYYARSEMGQLIRLSRLSARLLCLVLAVPISMLCAFSSTVLSLWLGESFAPLAPVLIIVVCHLVVNVGVLPLLNIRIALNKVRLPALVVVFMGGANLLLAIVFGAHLGWGIYGVAIAGALVLTLVNAVWNPIYCARIVRLPWYTFFESYTSGVFVLMVLTTMGMVMGHYVRPASWSSLVFLCAILSCVGACVAWVLLPVEDRRLIVDLSPKWLRGAVSKWLPA